MVRNKAYLIETSIHYLKVLVHKKKEKRKEKMSKKAKYKAFYWKFYSLTSAAGWLQLCEIKYDLMFLSSRFVSVAVREDVGYSLVE